MTTPGSLFPASEFDAWAQGYDASVGGDAFPFTGYTALLRTVFLLAEAHPGDAVLDLGTGTGNLALLFARQGCSLWCTDFSAEMLARARRKLPGAQFFQHDLAADFPAVLQRPFERIVSAYVFHHFPLDQKVRLLLNLHARLAPGGRLLIGDISFQDADARERVRLQAGEDWDEEFYWLAEESLAALRLAGLPAQYTQVSSCAGVYLLSAV